MIIYADVFIFENFIVDLFILTITMKCVRHKSNTKKLICSAMIGGIYAFVILMPQLKLFSLFPFEVIVAIIMIRIVYGKTGIFNLLKVGIVYFLLTCMLSGICFWFSTKQNIYILGNDFTIKKNSIKYILLAVIIIYLIVNRVVEYIKDRARVNGFIYLLKFDLNGEKYLINSFLDTGNELREPVTGLPCIFIEQEIVKNIDFRGKDSYSIPYNAIGYNGNIKGIRVNNLKITGMENFEKEVDAIICPCKEKLSKENEFNALLSRGIV